MLAGLKPMPRLFGAIALALAGCQAPALVPNTSPSVAPPSSSSASSTAAVGLPLAPLDAPATFGAVTAIDKQFGVPQVIYQVGVEDPSKKAYGTADARFVTVGDTRYAVAPDSWATADGLAIGATVNLYPSELATIFKHADGTTATTRLMDVYPGSHAEPPLTLSGLIPAF